MIDLNAFITTHMQKGKHPVPARLQAALGLLEKLREHPSLDMADHLAAKGSSGLESHETWGNKAHERFSLELINKNHGRRSSNLQDWGQALLDILKTGGFAAGSEQIRLQLIESAQAILASVLRRILEQEPLQARLRGRTAEAVISDLLVQAEAKGKTGDVAQYLVAAKLMIRLETEIPVHQANKPDRRMRGDRHARLGDIEIADAIVEVAVGTPDDYHIEKIVEALANTDKEVWLLTRAHRIQMWKDELKETDGVDLRRVVISSVEGFVGHNMTELGGFTARGRTSQLANLFKVYNDRWISAVGVPGIRIECIS